MRKNCPICSSQELVVVFEKKTYKIYQCKDCQFGVLNKHPSSQELKKIYNQSYFDDKKKEEFIKDAQRKFIFITKYLFPKARILDFGCGLGDFLGLCKSSGYAVSGYDISSYASQFVSKKYGIPVSSSKVTFRLFKSNHFDVITCFDVIEHELNFKKLLNFFYHWLKPGGYLFITTPNIESWDAKLLGHYWYGYTKIPEHINYFSPRSMKLLFKQSNLKIVKIANWGFIRSLGFVFERVNLKRIPLINAIETLCRKLGIDGRKMFFPMTDMIIVSRKQ